MMRIVLPLACVLVLAAWPAPATARPLDKGVTGLFGGTLSTFVDPRAGRDAQRPRVVDRFAGLTAAVSSVRSQLPVPSASGAFRYSWDDGSDTYQREPLPLGSVFGERATTLGRHVVALGGSYSHVEFDTFDGDSLADLESVQPAISLETLARLPLADRMRAEDDVLRTQLDFALRYDLVFLTAAYGLTDSVDASVALSINRAHMTVRGAATIEDGDGDGGAFFTVDQIGVITGGSGECAVDFVCAQDDYEETAVGLGDLYLRTKWHVLGRRHLDLAAAATITVPTGGGDDLLGFEGPTLTPLAVASSQLGPVSPHLNLGYAVRGDDDGRELQWVAGADVRLASRATASLDSLGYHSSRGGDIVQAAIGLRINPFSDAVLGLALQLPMNRDGLRADWIYTVQLQWTL